MNASSQPTSPPQRTRSHLIVAVLIVSLVLNVGLVGLFVYINSARSSYASQFSELSLQTENLTRQVENLRQQNELINKQLQFYQQQAEYFANQLKRNSATAGVSGVASVNVVAVSQSGSSLEGKTMKMTIELRSGSGRILINTEPKIGIDLQTSSRTAALVAEKITGADLSKTDIIITVKGSEAVEIVDGPSAGSAITMAIIAAIRNETLNSSTFMTGTINPDGTIGQVGGVLFKAVAAAEQGATKFLVPPGQKKAAILVSERREIAPGFVVITQRPQNVDLQEYLSSRGFSTTIVEVANVQDAYKQFAA